jgi:hypothetical protein
MVSWVQNRRGSGVELALRTRCLSASFAPVSPARVLRGVAALVALLLPFEVSARKPAAPPPLADQLRPFGFQPVSPFEYPPSPGDVFDLHSRDVLVSADKCLEDVAAKPRTGPLADAAAGTGYGFEASVDLEQLPRALRARAQAEGVTVASYSNLQNTSFTVSELRPSEACLAEVRSIVSDYAAAGTPVEPVWIVAVLRGDVALGHASASGGSIEAAEIGSASGSHASMSELIAPASVIALKTQVVRGLAMGDVPASPRSTASRTRVRPTDAPVFELSVLGGLPTGVRLDRRMPGWFRRVGLAGGMGGASYYSWREYEASSTGWALFVGLVGAEVYAGLAPFPRSGSIAGGLELEVVVGAYASTAYLMPGGYAGGGLDLRWGSPDHRFWFSAGLALVSSPAYPINGRIYDVGEMPRVTVGWILTRSQE